MENQGSDNRVLSALLSANKRHFPAHADAMRRLKGPIENSLVDSRDCNNPGSPSDAEGSGALLPEHHEADNENCLSAKHTRIILKSGSTKPIFYKREVQK